MIVPQNKLLWWVGLVLVPASVVGALFAAAAPVAMLLAALLVAWAVLDAALSAGSLTSIQLRMPPVVRLFKDRETAMEIEIVNPGRGSWRLRLGLVLPQSLGSAEDDVTVLLPADAEVSRVNWKCRPRQRGWHALQRACLERESRFGLWAVRAERELKVELRVYPDLMSERHRVAALFLNRGRLGAHARRQAGRGRDFEKLRDYVPGDSYDEVHWKATAKRGHPVTKVFQVERTQEVYVIVDASRLTARSAPRHRTMAVAGSRATGEEATDTATVLERFITSALLLGVAAEQQGDLFGLVTFSNRPKKFLRARSGPAHYNACRDALYTLEPEPVSPDFDELAAFLRVRLRRRTLLVVLTALDDPVIAEDFVRSMELLGRQHLIFVNMIPPHSVKPLFTNGEVESVDDLYRDLGGHLQWQKLRELEKVLQRRGVSLSLLDQERMSAQLVSQYLDVKQRQLL